MTLTKPATEWAIDADMALELAGHEAIILKAYKDSVGVWTWSVGLTSATGHDVTRYIDKPSSLERALSVYLWALRRYSDQVKQAFGDTPLTKEQFTAALSFHWNTGSIRKASWVLSFKAGNLIKARQQFMQYDKPASIIDRRKKEAALFFDGKWSNNGTMTEYTRLTRKYTPVWSSARRIDVLDLIEDLLTPDGPAKHGIVVVEDGPSLPDNEPASPTLTPSAIDKGGSSAYTRPNMLDRFQLWIGSVFS